jgi:hypothetical protein
MLLKRLRRRHQRQKPGLVQFGGLKVNKKGEVLNEDGEPVAKLSEGELADVARMKINDKGEVVDKEGNVVGKVEMIPQEPKEPAGRGRRCWP